MLKTVVVCVVGWCCCLCGRLVLHDLPEITQTTTVFIQHQPTTQTTTVVNAHAYMAMYYLSCENASSTNTRAHVCLGCARVFGYTNTRAHKYTCASFEGGFTKKDAARWLCVCVFVCRFEGI